MRSRTGCRTTGVWERGCGLAATVVEGVRFDDKASAKPPTPPRSRPVSSTDRIAKCQDRSAHPDCVQVLLPPTRNALALRLGGPPTKLPGRNWPTGTAGERHKCLMCGSAPFWERSQPPVVASPRTIHCVGIGQPCGLRTLRTGVVRKGDIPLDPSQVASVCLLLRDSGGKAIL